jgi:succinate dehydrogenase / fumarate reductase, cytochrome b subunit
VLYRGREGMLAWVLHRISGIAVALFLLLHVLDTALVTFGPDVYDHVLGIYRLPLIRVLEVALAAGVLYHAGNGIRVTLIDLWPPAIKYQRALLYGGAIIFPLIILPVAFAMLRPLFG